MQRPGGIAICLFLAAQPACRESDVSVALPEPSAPTGVALEPQAPLLRLAVAAMTSPATTFDSYVGFKDYLEQRLHGPVTLVLRRSYHETNELLRRSEIDVAFVCSGAYVRLAAEGLVKTIAVPKIAGKTTYHSLIVVRQALPAQSLRDLAGRLFAFTDPLSNTGHDYPVARAIELGFDPRTFFANTIYTHGHDNSLAALKRARADGAAVDSLVYDYYRDRDPERIEGLRVIESSPEFGSPPVVARAGLEAGLLEGVRTALLEMPEHATGRALLQELRIEAFVDGGDVTYDSVKAVQETVDKAPR